MTTLKELKEEYAFVLNKLNLLKASGSLSKLCNLRNTFDETFDKFFDQKSIRMNYAAWDSENDKPNFDISNDDIEQQLNETNKKELMEFYMSYIDSINEEIKEMENREEV